MGRVRGAVNARALSLARKAVDLCNCRRREAVSLFVYEQTCRASETCNRRSQLASFAVGCAMAPPHDDVDCPPTAETGTTARRKERRRQRWEQRAIDAALAADRAARSGWCAGRPAQTPESWRVLRDGTVQFKMRQWHGTWRWLVHADSGSETEGMTTEVADERSV